MVYFMENAIQMDDDQGLFLFFGNPIVGKSHCRKPPQLVKVIFQILDCEAWQHHRFLGAFRTMFVVLPKLVEIVMTPSDSGEQLFSGVFF